MNENTQEGSQHLERRSGRGRSLREIVRSVLKKVPRMIGITSLLLFPATGSAVADNEVAINLNQSQAQEEVDVLKYRHSIIRFAALPSMKRITRTTIGDKFFSYLPKMALGNSPHSLFSSLHYAADNLQDLLIVEIKTREDKRVLENYISENVEASEVGELLNFIYMSKFIRSNYTDFIYLDEQGRQENPPPNLLERVIAENESKIKKFLHNSDVKESDFRLPESVLYAYLERNPKEIKKNVEKIKKFIINDSSGTALHFLFYIMKQQDTEIKRGLFSSLEEFSRLLMQKAENNKDFFWLYMSVVLMDFSMDKDIKAKNIQKLIGNRAFYNSLGDEFDWGKYIKNNNSKQSQINAIFAFVYSYFLQNGQQVPVGSNIDRQLNELVKTKWQDMKNDPGFNMLLDETRFLSTMNSQVQFELGKTAERKILQGSRERLYHKVCASLLSKSDIYSISFLTEVNSKKQTDLLKSLDSDKLWYIMRRMARLSLFGSRYALDKNHRLSQMKLSDFYSGPKSAEADSKQLARFIFNVFARHNFDESALIRLVRNFLKKESGQDAELLDKALIHIRTSLYSHRPKKPEYMRDILNLISHERHLRLIKLSAAEDPLLHAGYLEMNYNSTTNEEINATINGMKTFVLNYLADSYDPVKYNKVIRIINHLHPHKLSKYRGEIIDLLSLKQRYTLSVYGAEELFTSTSTYVNYLFPAIMKDVEKLGIKQYLERVDKEGILLGKFFKVAARYGKLEQLFNGLSLDDVANITEHILGRMSADNALTMVEIFKLFKDKPADIEKLLIDLHKLDKHFQDSGDTIRKRMLETTASLIYHSSIKNYDLQNEKLKLWLKSSAGRERLFIPDKITFNKLYLQEGDKMVHRQLWLFFEGGDKDGVRSRWSAVSRLKKAGFKFKTLRDDVRLATKTRGDKVVEIYLSNIISVEDVISSPAILDLMSGADKKFQVLTYRGHSTYIPKFSEFLHYALKGPQPLALINLGSCGGVSSIGEVADSIPQEVPAWIGTQATGTAEINDLILSNMATTILQINPGQELDFRSLKQKINNQISAGFMRQWQAYKFPYENIAAILTIHFNRIKRQSAQDRPD